MGEQIYTYSDVFENTRSYFQRTNYWNRKRRHKETKIFHLKENLKTSPSKRKHTANPEYQPWAIEVRKHFLVGLYSGGLIFGRSFGLTDDH